MRNYLIISLLLFTAGVMAQMPLGRNNHRTFVDEGGTPPQVELAVIHYPFENNGDDISGNDNDATTSSMVYTSSSPAAGSYSGDFTSSGREFSWPSGYTLTAPHTISMWVRQTNIDGYFRLMDPHQTNSGWEYWLFWLDGYAFDLEYRGYQNSTGDLDRAGTANSVWSAGSDWMMITWTYEANGDVEIFLDGTSVSTGQSTWNTSNMKLSLTPMYIGLTSSASIDEFFLFEEVLTPTQITSLYGGGTPGTILYQ